MSLPTALSYLTILRLPRQRQFDLRRAVFWFPVVGLFLGAFLALLWTLLSHAVPPGLSALLLVVGWIWITGGVHLDGLANTSEALLSWRSRASMHEILTTPHIGSLGMIAVIGTLSVKIAALHNLEADRAAAALLAAPLFGRCAQLLATVVSPYAKEDGVAVSAFSGSRPWLRLLLGLLPLGLAFRTGILSGALALAGFFLLFVLLVRRIRVLLGGMTGATLGALTEIVEAWVLVAATVQAPHLSLPSWTSLLGFFGP